MRWAPKSSSFATGDEIGKQPNLNQPHHSSLRKYTRNDGSFNSFSKQ